MDALYLGVTYQDETVVKSFPVFIGCLNKVS